MQAEKFERAPLAHTPRGVPVVAEEAVAGGDNPEVGRIFWLVDPLDGTNNYVMGMPMFGVCITALAGDEPLVAVVHESVRGITTSAMRGTAPVSGNCRNWVPKMVLFDVTWK